VRRRQYPSGELSERSRSIAEASAGWLHSLRDGAAGVSLTVRGGYNYATRRPDGDSGFFGATAGFDYSFSDRVSAFAFADWERNRFNAENVHFSADVLEDAVVLRRRDNLYQLGGGAVWGFAESWSLEPQILYQHDESNVDDFDYSATEIWVNVRRSF